MLSDDDLPPPLEDCRDLLAKRRQGETAAIKSKPLPRESPPRLKLIDSKALTDEHVSKVKMECKSRTALSYQIAVAFARRRTTATAEKVAERYGFRKG